MCIRDRCYVVCAISLHYVVYATSLYHVVCATSLYHVVCATSLYHVVCAACLYRVVCVTPLSVSHGLPLWCRPSVECLCGCSLRDNCFCAISVCLPDCHGGMVAGRWRVSMYYNNKYMDGCPIDVCDPSQVRVRDLRGGLIGKQQTFHGTCIILTLIN